MDISGPNSCKVNYLIFVFSLLLSLSGSSLLYSQTINIPDSNLKQRLLDYDPPIDTDGDGEIQVSEAEAVIELNLNTVSSNQVFSDPTGLEYFVNLTDLKVNGNNINIIDLSVYPDLESFWCMDNPLQQIDLSQNTHLSEAFLSGTDITSIDVTSNIELKNLEVYETFVPEIDISNNPEMEYLNFFGNDELLYLNLKNGNSDQIDLGEGFLDTPNVQMVCVDDTEAFLSAHPWNATQLDDLGAVLTNDCDFDPDAVNTITGVVNLDYGEGCDDSFGIPNVIIKSETSGNEFATITNEDGEYELYTKTGENEVGAVLVDPPYFTSTPDSYVFDFNGYDNTETADFCLEASEYVEDLSISIYGSCPSYWTPYGGESRFFIVTVENKGTEKADGEVEFHHSDDFYHYDMDTHSAIPQPTPGVVELSFSDLKPFHQEEFIIYMRAVNDPSYDLGDTVEFTGYVFPDENDYTPEDNTYTVEMGIRGSYDPNDKRVMEGEEVHIDDADQYLHYLINFQNTGNANADWVKVVDTLSDKLDWSTFKLEYASHDYRVEIKNDYIFNFIFEDIDLAYEDADEEGSQGYIAYKVKPKEDVEVGDVVGSEAHIFFDQNEAIITNLPTTIFVEDLSVDQPDLKEGVLVYPNPTKGMLNIQTPEDLELESISIYEINGKLIQSQKASEQIDFSRFSSGIYFMELETQEGSKTIKRILKE